MQMAGFGLIPALTRANPGTGFAPGFSSTWMPTRRPGLTSG